MTDSRGEVPEPSETAGLLAQLFAPGAEDFGALAAAAEPPLHWPSMPAEDVDAAWPELYGWVAALQQRFPEMVRLPACWYRHNGLVEALEALRDHERSSYAATAPPTAAVAWHIAFRDIEARLRTWIADLRCGGDLRCHQEDTERGSHPRHDPPEEFMEWIAGDRCNRAHASRPT